MIAGVGHVTLTPRPVASSVDELLDGAVRSGPFRPEDARSSASFERVVVDGERCVVKYVHPRSDFTMRVTGDIGCRPRRVWEAGLMDVASAHIDHATLGAAPWGPNGWGVALLMRDLSDELVPIGGEPVPEDDHFAFVDAMAAQCAALWGWQDTYGLMPHRVRWSMFGTPQLGGEAALGWPEAVPKIAHEGWQQFATRAPADIVDAIEDLRRDTTPLSDALLATPQTFLHGDWKMGNMGIAHDGRVVLIDWAYPGQGPACHELAWYLALNRDRIPRGYTKESTIAAYRAALIAHGVDTDPWWTTQLELCLLGILVLFGWEKARGDEDELRWWIEAARAGIRHV